jgi:cation diffusion facilitator family transporter
MLHIHHSNGQQLLDTQRGLWVIKITFVALVATAVVEGVITYMTGSAALLADSIHGFSNALGTIPLWVALAWGRKKPNREYSYGYHRAEDLAGVLIVLFIAISAVVVGFESVRRLMYGHEPENILLAMGAGAVGFFANEAIAQYRIKVGKQIGSVALIADGHHARVDGLGSLAVVLGLIPVAMGFPIADPAVGLVITGLIIYLLVREAGPMVLSRAMDRIDPSILGQLEQIAKDVPGVLDIYDVRARWIGRGLQAELSIAVNPNLTVAQGHRITEVVRLRITSSMPKLQWCTIRMDPFNGPLDLSSV